MASFLLPTTFITLAIASSRPFRRASAPSNLSYIHDRIHYNLIAPVPHTVRSDPLLKDKNVRFVGIEGNGTRWRLIVSSNNFTKDSDIEWMKKLQTMDSVELIPLSDDQLGIIADAETARSLFYDYEFCDDDDASLSKDRYSVDSEWELLPHACEISGGGTPQKKSALGSKIIEQLIKRQQLISQVGIFLTLCSFAVFFLLLTFGPLLYVYIAH